MKIAMFLRNNGYLYFQLSNIEFLEREKADNRRIISFLYNGMRLEAAWRVLCRVSLNKFSSGNGQAPPLPEKIFWQATPSPEPEKKSRDI